VMTAPPDKKTGQPDLFGAPPSEPQNDPQSAVLSITRPAALLIFVHTQYARLLFSFYLTHSLAFHCQHFYCVSLFQIRLLFFFSSNCSFCLITQTACTKHLHLQQNKHCRICWEFFVVQERINKGSWHASNNRFFTVGWYAAAFWETVQILHSKFLNRLNCSHTTT
jgi:hypothetical protein